MPLSHLNSTIATPPLQLPNYAAKTLQHVQNAAARLKAFSSTYNHITPILKDLHWLPMTERIKFKIFENLKNLRWL